MHPAARQWVHAHVPVEPGDVIEVGGRDVNGGVRDLFHAATSYTSVDPAGGNGVDVREDFLKYDHDGPADVVVCCEVAEHVENWRDILEHAAVSLRKGGTLIFTAATEPRPPHSVDGCSLKGGEWYENINPGDLRDCLTGSFKSVTVDVLNDDVRAVAVK